MSISLKLLGSKNSIQKTLFTAMAKDLNLKLKKNYKKAEDKVRSLVQGWIFEQPEISSILDDGVLNSLNAQFGFMNGTASQAIEVISLAVAKSVAVEFQQINDKLQGGVIFYLQPDNFSNILGLPEAVIQSTSTQLPWLNWMLTQGSNTIVSGYTYKPDNSGRSGGGTMVSGNLWRIPPNFAGTVENNFITRALQGREKELSSIMEEAFYG